MIVGFLGAELPRWDALLREGAQPMCLGLPFFDDERPLRGAAGLCDWRLGGRISRLLGARIGPQRDDRGGAVKLRGTFGEKLLLPTGPRLPFTRLVLYGLGAQAAFDEKLARRASRELLEALQGVSGVDASSDIEPHLAIVPPGRSTGALSARRAVEILLDEAAPRLDGARLSIVESAVAQKEAGELVRRWTSDAAITSSSTSAPTPTPSSGATS